MSSKPGGFFHPSARGSSYGKAAGIRRLFVPVTASGLRSEPLTPAAIAAVAPVMVHAAFHPAVAPATLPAEATVAGQDGKAALLTVVQGLVERVGGIRDLPHRRRGSRHVVGAFAKSRNRILGLLLVLGIIPRLHPRVGAIDPHLGKIPYRPLD